jgi:hypothetical protein
MTKYVLVILAAVICGIVIGVFLAVTRISNRTSDGVCIRANDGEVYLRISEAGQEKLADPTTRLLLLKVTDISTRNNQLL